MKYISLNHNSAPTSFKKAVINGLAPDKGLYFPKNEVKLSASFIESLKNIDDFEICYEVIRKYIGDEIPKNKLLDIVKDTVSFKIPLKKIEKSIYSLELYHGPTLAFKDIGAKFMALCLDYFKDSYTSKKITVLVATSGDTGGAVANGFSGTKDIDVCILYPKGKISEVQEKQITTNGSYVNAIEVEGDFDLCQSMVKRAFNDEEINRKIALTSANSINVARWLPQMFYYFLAYKKIKNKKKNIFSVPSGNFGNICAGILGKSMGLPIDHFIASTNINDTIPRYIRDGIFEPNDTQQTISNAMDVSNPSNFIRIQRIFNNDLQKIRKNISGYSYDDRETKETIKRLYNSQHYLLDPHSAIGYLGLKEYMDINKDDVNGIFISTAHTIKFKNIVEETIKSKIKYPNSIKEILKKEKTTQLIDSYSELKEILLNRS
ncbi:MAG: threonine synthase [Cryomorphaceae bacterium]|nr:threonine synthase [Cryomorphaceae bacterium]MDG1889036.1 threonine synthase [Flavobacteriaceae bacterium]MBT3503122.1 threonine synthase [Cryomorphaceae bacterium]MBT3689324.1 threonine synthase [Cryomorphaceae bacterium]MBT4222027.1 threonine synthase [Cryomorphaceae bacterium]